MNLSLKIVKSDDLLNLRSKILRNNLDPNLCRFPGDKEINSFHIGAFNGNTLIGGVSVMKNECKKKELPNCSQLRGLFVDKEFQHNGIGKTIVNFVENRLRDSGVNYLWMNARESAVLFYLKLNYSNSKISYVINEIGLHYLMYKKL
ncbi:MAG: GNAT family N-acetyltransferase [Flavobacteriaceae bacterium]